ncbi:MAG TPA: amidohydrolase family protein [Acidimicrobiales bacterium]|nr:amidohydrolase family protein [Acidimicrobiales bacterium]
MIPKIISVDDHVIEPPGVWVDRLPSKYDDVMPRLVRHVGWLEWRDQRPYVVDDKGDGSQPMDIWHYEGRMYPITRGTAHVGFPEENALRPITLEEMLPGCYIQSERLAALDRNHTEASISFPSFFPRFCGQTFMEAEDRELALLCVRAYNDWMIDEWCAGDAHGRLIPQTIIPMWDPELSADEVRRCAAKGSFAITFTEQPYHLGLPSMYSGGWDPLWAACQETETVVNMHIGSSSRLPTTSPDAPWEATMSLNSENSVHAFCDWIISGTLARFPTLRIALSEGQVGWIPFFLARMDDMWDKTDSLSHLRDRLPEPPSSYVNGRIWGCVFNDLVGLRTRDMVGMSQIMFETDYPHLDSTYPDSAQVAEDMIKQAELDEKEAWMLLRGNAIECYRLQRYGITE